MSYVTAKYLLWVLLSLPVLAASIYAYLSMKSYVNDLEHAKRKKAELKRQQEEALRQEEERSPRFEAEYMNSRGGRQ